MYYVNEGLYGEKDFKFEYELQHPTFNKLWSFYHCNLPPMGLGEEGTEIVNFNRLVDPNLIPIIKDEVEASANIKYNPLVQNGIFPKAINGERSVDSYLANIDKYYPEYNEALRHLDKKRDIKIAIQDKFNISRRWEGIAMFRNYSADYFDKSKPSDWLPWVQKDCPTLVRLVESLPFDHVGYVIAFKSRPNTAVFTHRDFYPCNHDVDFINIQLDWSPRPFFLYDPNTGEKKYLDRFCYAYWFNETDLHGVDAEPISRITLRVEGKFNVRLKKALGITRAFDWSFPKAKKFLESGKFQIDKNTDI